MTDATCSFSGCIRAAKALGLCTGHWQQQHRGRELAPLRDNGAGQSAQQRLDKYTDKSGECWIWTGTMQHNGYGWFYYQGRGHNAHRIAYLLHRGTIADGLVVDHMCHNRSCVRPSHLQAVTTKQNIENRGSLNANNASGERGVYWSTERNKWIAQLRHEGRIRFLGRFDNFDQAVAAVRIGRTAIFTNNLIDRDSNIKPASA